jgi:hypothetical protein
MRFYQLIDEIKETTKNESDADNSINEVQDCLDENIAHYVNVSSTDDIIEVARELGLLDIEAIERAVYDVLTEKLSAIDIHKELEDEATRCDECYALITGEHVSNTEGNYCDLDCLKTTLESGDFYVFEGEQLELTESEYNEIHGN